MPFTLLRNAKKFIAGAAGECDDASLTEAVNNIRREWYSWYERLPMFRYAEECFEVQSFTVDCALGDCRTYQGVTLPNDYAAIEAMWWGDRRVELFDRWRQWQYGMAPRCDCRLESYAMGQFATSRDLAPNRASRLAFTALDSRDRGKKIEFHGRLDDGRDYVGKYELLDTPQLTAEVFASLNRQGVIKDLTLGRVALAEENGRLLDLIAPDVTVPQYGRIKITGLPSNCEQVNIRAARQFTFLYDDGDVVEIDNQQAWAAMARAQRLDAKPVKDANELRSLSADKLLCESLLRGDNVRQQGKSNRVDVRIPMPPIGRGSYGLFRNRGRGFR